MVKNQSKLRATDSKVVDSKVKGKNAALPQSKHPQPRQKAVTEKMSTRKQVLSKKESPASALSKSKVVKSLNDTNSEMKTATRGRKKLTATEKSTMIESNTHQKQSALTPTSAGTRAAATRLRARKTLNSNNSSTSHETVPGRMSKKNAADNTLKKAIKATVREGAQNLKTPNTSTQSNHQIDKVSVSGNQISKTAVHFQQISETPVKATVPKRAGRKKLPSDSDPADVREVRGSRLPSKSSRNQSKSIAKNGNGASTACISSNRDKNASKFPGSITPTLSKKQKGAKTPILSVTRGIKTSQIVKSVNSGPKAKVSKFSNISIEKLESLNKLETSQSKKAVSQPINEQLNLNSPNADVNSPLHADTLLSGSINLSSLGVTESPIIRTRKVNPKYADCVIPPQFAFFKQAFSKSVRTPSSIPSSQRLFVSTPVPLVVIKDVTGFDKGNLEDAGEESPTNSNECSSTEAPCGRLGPLEERTLVSRDLDSGVSENAKVQGSVARGHRVVNKTSKSNLKAQTSATDSALSKKIDVISQNNASAITKTKKINSIAQEKMYFKSKSSARLADKSKKIVMENVETSVISNKGTPSCVVKLSEFPIKLAVFRSPSRSAPVDEPSCPRQLGDEQSESQPEQQQDLSLTSVEPPRPSKRKLLALALKEGRLGKIASARAIKKSDVKLNVPVLVKSNKNTSKNKSSSVVEVRADRSATLDSSKVVGTKQNNSTVAKKPVWAQAMSPVKKVKRLSSTRTKEPASHQSPVVFDFSFNSEDDKTQSKTRKVRKKAKTTMPKTKPMKVKPKSTKTKILTTDPNFEKEFPTTWDSRRRHNGKPVVTSSNQALVGDSFHVDSYIQDDHFDDLEPDICPASPMDECLLNNVNSEETRELLSQRTEVMSNNGVPERQAMNADCPDGSNMQNNFSQSGCNCVVSDKGNQRSSKDLVKTPLRKSGEDSNTGKASGSGNMVLPTPDATRLMAKFVAGTSTPFPASGSGPVGSSQGPTVPISFPAASNTIQSQPEPITVSEQIKTCFGFDESDDDVNEDGECEFTSFNLSPVRRENGSFCPFPHQYSVLSDAGNGSMRGLVSRNNSIHSNMSRGAFLRPTVAAITSRSLAKSSVADTRVNTEVSASQGTFRILTKTVPISSKSSLLSQFPPSSGRQPSKIVSRSIHSAEKTNGTQSSAAGSTISVTQEPGATSTQAACTLTSGRGSVSGENRNKQSTSTSTSDGKKNGDVPSSTAVGSLVEGRGAREERRLFDDVNASPAKLSTPSKGPQVEVDIPAAASDAVVPVVSPENSFSEPVRHAYDRRSLELSRRALLESLAVGPPQQEDDEADMADEEGDVSSAGAPRRRKRRGAAASSATESGIPRGKSRLAAKQPTITEAFKRSSATTRDAGNKDSSLEEGAEECGRPTKRGIVRPRVATKSRSKRPLVDAVEGNNNKKAKNQQQPESILVTDHKTSKATKTVMFDGSRNSSTEDSSNASTSTAAKRPKHSKKPTKAAAFEKSVNDWASDLNSHFSEVEDSELVVA